MTKTIKRGLSGLRDASLSVQTQHILESLTGNINFPTPTPTLAIIQKAADDYSKALSEAKDRDKEKVLIKNEMRKDLEAQLNQLFDYVNLTGGTDITILTSSGFPLAKERKPVGDMPKPENFRVTLGDGSGEVHLGAKKIHGADSYVFQYIISPSPEVDNWSVVNDSRSRITITGLQPGTQYKFRVAAVGSRGLGPWSDAITRYVA